MSALNLLAFHFPADESSYRAKFQLASIKYFLFLKHKFFLCSAYFGISLHSSGDGSSYRSQLTHPSPPLPSLQSNLVLMWCSYVDRYRHAFVRKRLKDMYSSRVSDKGIRLGRGGRGAYPAKFHHLTSFHTSYLAAVFWTRYVNRPDGGLCR